MEKFTGADITEMCCLCATAKYAIRGQVEADMEQQHAAEAAGHEYMEVVDEKFDDVSEINEEHFEMATSEARCSLSVAGHHPPGLAETGASLLPRGRAVGLATATARNCTHRKLLGEGLPGVGERER